MFPLLFVKTYFCGGDKGCNIIQGDECHKLANVIDKPGCGVQWSITGIVASDFRACGNRSNMVII